MKSVVAEKKVCQSGRMRILTDFARKRNGEKNFGEL
jgi:hypothetical protein